MSLFEKIKKNLLYRFHKLIKPEIIGQNKIKYPSIGVNTGISNFCHISYEDDNLIIGENVFIGHFTYIDAKNSKVIIGNNVQITNYVNILTHSTHNNIRFPNSESNEELRNTGTIKIGDFSYVGPNTVIMPNSSIGKGCIISAYSYVKGEFPDYSIIRGLPAKIVGDTRKIDEELISKYPDLKKHHFEANNK